jgi:hypothetical protein
MAALLNIHSIILLKYTLNVLNLPIFIFFLTLFQLLYFELEENGGLSLALQV